MKGTGSLSAYAGQTITLTGIGTLLAQGVVLTGVGTAGIDTMPISATLTGYGEGYAFLEIGSRGTGYLAALTSIGADYEYATAPNQELAALTSEGYGGVYVPATPVMGFGYLQPLVSVGHIVRTHVMEGDADLAALTSIGADYEYATAPDQELAALRSIGFEGYSDLAVMMEHLYAVDENTPSLDMIIVLTDSGTIAGTFVGTSIAIQQMLSEMTVEDSYSILAEINLTMLAEAVANGEVMAQVQDGTTGEVAPGLDDASTVWVVNLDTGAASQYEQFGYKRIFERDGYYYGVAEDGIYLLDGEDDDGEDIATYIDFGQNDSGLPGRNKILNIHVGTSDGSDMYLRVTAKDGKRTTTNTYRLEECRRGPTGWRAKLPWNMQGVDWRFELIADNAFELDGIEFVPAKLTRRM